MHDTCKISIYEDKNLITSSKSNYVKMQDLELQEIIEVIRVGGGRYGIPDLKPAVNYVRTNTKADGQRTKEHLQSFTVAAQFTTWKRGKTQPHVYTNLMILDIDGLTVHEVETQKQVLISWGLALAVFVSPSGKGLKVIVRLTNCNSGKHESIFTLLRYYFKEKFKLELDSSGSDLSRLCYLSFDENIYFNDEGQAINAEELEEKHGQVVMNTPGFEAGTVIDESNIDRTTVSKTFNSFVKELANSNNVFVDNNKTLWMLALTRLKAYGMTVGDVLPLAMEHPPIAAWLAKSPTKNTADIQNRLTYNFQHYYKHYSPVAPVPATPTHTITHYLAEHLDLIQQRVEQQKTVFLDAPTGSGKTSMVRLLAKRMRCKVDLLMPTTALVEQQAHGATIAGQGTIETIVGRKRLEGNHLSADVLAACYPAIAKLKKRKAAMLVIDEAHSLVADYSWKSDGIQLINKLKGRYEYVVYLSGSMFPLAPLLTTDNYLKFSNSKRFEYEYELVGLESQIRTKLNREGVTDPQTKKVYEVSGSKLRDYFFTTIDKKALNVLYLNNKKELKKLQTTLQNMGFKVALFSKDELLNNDDEFAGSYAKLVNDSLLNNVDVLLTTCLIQAGININNVYNGEDEGLFDAVPTKEKVLITFASSANAVDMVQFTARFRKTKPYVRIVHNNLNSRLTAFNEIAHREIINSKIKLLMELERENRNCATNEVLRQRINRVNEGITLDVQGDYITDEYYLYHKHFEANMSNANNHVNHLTKMLEAYGFTLSSVGAQPGRNSYIGTLSEADAKGYSQVANTIKKTKQATETALIAEMLSTGYVFSYNENDALRYKLERRLDKLLMFVDKPQIQAEQLLTDTNFKHFARRVAFLGIESDKTNKLQLPADVILENKHFNKLKASLAPNFLYNTADLKRKVLAVPELKYSEGKYLTALKVMYHVNQQRERVTVTDPKTGKVKVLNKLTGYKLKLVTWSDYTKKTLALAKINDLFAEWS